MARILIGYRVKDSDNQYVYKSYTDPSHVWSQEAKTPVLGCAEAHRLLASWLDAGYKGRIFRVYSVDNYDAGLEREELTKQLVEWIAAGSWPKEKIMQWTRRGKKLAQVVGMVYEELYMQLCKDAHGA